MVLAWAPWVPAFFGLLRSCVGVKGLRERAGWARLATGLAAVAGGMAEMLVMWGLVALIIAQVVAMIWLLRSFSKIDMSRNVVSFFSICACGLTLLWLGGFLWLTRYIAHW